MMKKFNYIFILLLCISINKLQAQENPLTESYDLKKLNDLYTTFQNQYEKNQAKILNNTNFPLKKINEDGTNSILIRITEDGLPIYYKPNNTGAAETTSTDQLYPGGSLGLNITGSTMTFAYWDSGLVRNTHELFEGRVSQNDGASNLDNHATHVGGTLIGGDLSGAASVARGMAYEATLVAYDFGNDLAEMVIESSGGLTVSNHSYGIDSSNLPTFYFGRYDEKALAIDQIAYTAPGYLMVVSAGNDRNAGFNVGDNGYDLITDMGAAKNSLTVAAVQEVSNYSGPSDVVMSSFSSWGPTDDRRIKPDISGKGVGVVSALASSNSAYGAQNGTSMSSPNVAGSLVLLQEYYNQLNNTFMRAATLKGLAINTAKEAGDNPGPDPKFGWGLLDTAAAAQVIEANTIQEESLSNGETETFTFTSNGEPLTITISWTDPSGPLQGNTNDDATPRLVNDLDIRVTDSNGDEYLPWRLHPFLNGNPAFQADNSIDNVEQIDIASPALNEEYTVTVTHKGTLVNQTGQNAPQEYSLIASGVNSMSTNSYEISKQVKTYPNPTNSNLNILLPSSINLTNNELEFSVFDLNGKKIKQGKTFVYNNNAQINTSSLNSGVYILSFEVSGEKIRKKIIKI